MPPVTYLCVSIDCERDKGPRWRVRRPASYVGIHEGIARRLQPLFVRRGAKATYLLSPEVIDDGRSAETLRALEGDHELGTHLHAEYAEPDRTDPDETAAFQRDCSPDVEQRKLAYLTRRFREEFGAAPRSFRAGRFGIGPHSIAFLEDLGYAVESSVTPFVDWRDKHPSLTFVGAPDQPYRPDPQDPRARGASRLIEVPVTIRPHTLARVPLLGRRLPARWLRPTHGTADGLVSVAKDAIDAARARSSSGPIVLNAMFHNVEICAGTSPYAATDDQARAILGRLDALLAFAAREGIRGIGLGDVPEVLA